MTLEIAGFIIALLYFLRDFVKPKAGNSILILTENGNRIKSKWGYLTSVASQKYGIDEKIILGVIGVESDGIPNAVGSIGEIGLMQLSPTGALVDYRNENKTFFGDPFLPANNIDIGTWYLRKIHQAFPLEDWFDKIQAYNTGIAGYKNGRRLPEYVERLRKYVTNNVNT